MAAIISKTTIKRLIRDIVEIKKNPLDNIYYQHSENNILQGHALIIGPSNTPYEGGYYFFKVDYPINYPHEPPKYTFLTNNGYTRMNPNTYKDGKVCISILNTWHGDQWSGCQTISSTLLSISTVFNAKPLLNEPGMTTAHTAFQPYQQSISYMNLRLGMVDILNNNYLFSVCPELIMIAKKDYIDNFSKKRARFTKAKEEWIQYHGVDKNDITHLNAGIYHMVTPIDYKTLFIDMQELKRIIENNLKKSK